MGKLSEFFINLDSPRQVFYPGEQLSGHVLMNLQEPLKMRNLRIQLEGKGHCHWSETSGSGEHSRTVHYTGNETLVDVTVFLFGSKGDSVMHPPGRHIYQFAIILPHPLPSSFEGSIGHIRYYLKAQIDRPWKFDHKTKRPLIINEVIDINLPQYLNGPGGDATKEVGCLCCAAGPLVLHGHLDRAGYCPGEFIIINAQIENRTSRDMPGSKAKLVQKISYHASSKTKHVTNVISRLDGPPIPKHDLANWVNQALQISAIPPSILTSRVVNVSYTLEVEVDVPMAFDLKVALPITVGTVPFRATYGVNTYAMPPQNQAFSPGHGTYAQPSAPAMPPPPPQLLGYPDMAPPSYAAAVGDREVSIADDDEKHLFGLHTYLPVYTYAQPYAGPAYSPMPTNPTPYPGGDAPPYPSAPANYPPGPGPYPPAPAAYPPAPAAYPPAPASFPPVDGSPYRGAAT